MQMKLFHATAHPMKLKSSKMMSVGGFRRFPRTLRLSMCAPLSRRRHLLPTTGRFRLSWSLCGGTSTVVLEPST